MTENIKIWEKILPELVKEIKKADDKSYSINLLEEVKMANKFVRETKMDEEKDVSLRVNVDENANSRILAKLLQYKSPDGKYEILQSLLDYIRDRDENAVSNFRNIKINNDNTIITTEETLTQDNGRIDILVRTGSNAIIFENKLFGAGDQPNQLARYIENVKNVNKLNSIDNYSDRDIFVIYLSMNGGEPNKDSWKKTEANTSEANTSYLESFADRYANLSFKDDILPWLKDYVLPNVRKKDTDLESALVQYINYLDRMFMKNNDDLTNWLEEKLEKGKSNESPHLVKIHRLEKVEELLANLKGNEEGNGEINDEIAKLFTKDNTNEDILNKAIAVIENLRNDCRDKVLETFYLVSKGYFDEILPSHPSAAYCRLFKKKWKGEIRFIWNPFFFLDKKYRNKYYKYPLMLDILHSSNDDEFKERINKLKGVLAKVEKLQKNFPKEMKLGNDLVKISYKILSNDLDSINNKKDNKMHPIIFCLTLTTEQKLLYFAPGDQEKLFKAIYDSLSGVIEAIDKCFENPAMQ